MDFTNKILLGDCLEVMKDIPDQSVDMVLCDLPYGTTQNLWDSVIDLDRFWFQVKRIIKHKTPVVLTAQTPFDKVLGCSNLGWLRYEWIWSKNIATGHLNVSKAPMKKHENILIFSNGQPIYNSQISKGKPYKNIRTGKDDNGSNYGNINVRTDTINAGWRYPTSILEFERETGFHPTQKPVPLFEYLIKTYTNEGDLILDPTIGSGTTAIAALNTNRKFIGIEKDPEYHQKACERVNKHISESYQQSLSK